MTSFAFDEDDAGDENNDDKDAHGHQNLHPPRRRERPCLLAATPCTSGAREPVFCTPPSAITLTPKTYAGQRRRERPTEPEIVNPLTFCRVSAGSTRGFVAKNQDQLEVARRKNKIRSSMA